MAVWLPAWSVNLIARRDRRSPEGARDRRPLILVARDGQRQVVAGCCERARGVGVRSGMVAAEARALFEGQGHRGGGVRVEPHDPERDLAALRVLAVWAQRFSPITAADAPDGLLIDVTGCSGVFGGEQRLLELVARGLARLGIESRIAVAPSFGAAWALCCYGGQRLSRTYVSELRGALTEVSVEGLRIGAEHVAQLAEVGVRRIGQLMELPRSAIPARFGDELLLKLDRALGQAMEHIEPIRPLPRIEAKRVFEGPTGRVEAVEHAARETIAEMADSLQRRGVGATAVRLELRRSDLPPETLSLVLGRPSRDASHLWSLLRPKLERAHLGFGVEAVRVIADSTGPVVQEQMRHFGDRNNAGSTDADADRLGHELIDTLVNKLGRDRVLRTEVVESHLPERACRFVPMADPRAKSPAMVASRDRPTLLYRNPSPAEVVALTPDGPVHRLRWRGEDIAVAACIGPERLEREWWRPSGSTRDCFKIRTEDGRWLWLARSLETGRWFVHGAWV